MTIIIAVIVGFILGSIPKDGLNDVIVRTYTKLHEYLRSPSTDKLDLDWTTRQIIRVLSTNASERWYEARVHLYQGVIKSLICTFGLIYLVRIDLIDHDQQKGKCRVFVFHGFQSLEEVMKKKVLVTKIYTMEVNANLDKDEKVSYYQTFIAGHNVVHDYMDGIFD